MGEKICILSDSLLELVNIFELLNSIVSEGERWRNIGGEGQTCLYHLCYCSLDFQFAPRKPHMWMVDCEKKVKTTINYAMKQ